MIADPPTRDASGRFRSDNLERRSRALRRQSRLQIGAAAEPDALDDGDDAWAIRAEYWAAPQHEPAPRPTAFGPIRVERKALVLNGHGVQIRIQNGALVVRNGFTHYPQRNDEQRFFPGARNLPSRIIALDNDGSITFDVIQWLGRNKVPLIALTWQGDVVSVIGGDGTPYDADLRRAQHEAITNGVGLQLSTQLIADKISGCRESLLTLWQTPARDAGIVRQSQCLRELEAGPTTYEHIRLIEARAALAYFTAWQEQPIRWKGIGRKPIPAEWHRIGLRQGLLGASNRYASHPVNAMLNYGYALLETQVRIQTVAHGLDPTIGYLHANHPGRLALVYDLMEPLRPEVDRYVLEVVREHTFAPNDFLITARGMVRLHPQTYNTGNDFIYRDDYAHPLDAYLVLTGQKDLDGNLLTSNPETSGRYHSSWLSMMYPRLFLARQLLREDGVIFVSVDDHEEHDLRLLMNEIFGEENSLGTLVWQSKKGGGGDSGNLVQDNEYVLCYRGTNNPHCLSRVEIAAEELDRVDVKGPYRRGRELNKWGSGSRRDDRPTMYFPIPGPDSNSVYPIRNDGSEGRWRKGLKKMLALVNRGDVEFEQRPDGSYIVYEKIRSADPRLKPYRTWLTDVGTTADGSKTVKELFDGRSVYDYPKPVALLKRLIFMGTNGDDDLVLDFFAGSCTTAQAVLELNREDEGSRRFICVQVPEPSPLKSEARKAGYGTLADVGKERIRRVMFRMNQDSASALDLRESDEPEDLGFRVLKLVQSNLRGWNAVAAGTSPTEYASQLEMLEDPLVPGWMPLQVIYEIAIKEGLSLTFAAEEAIVDGVTIWNVTDDQTGQGIKICLDDALCLDTVRALDLTKEDRFICRDIALDDTVTANLALQCHLKTI
ncbi:MAG: CRISPR-associated endonuclease Cas1 [Chloroflexota bacterium]